MATSATEAASTASIVVIETGLESVKEREREKKSVQFVDFLFSFTRDRVTKRQNKRRQAIANEKCQCASICLICLFYSTHTLSFSLSLSYQRNHIHKSSMVNNVGTTRATRKKRTE